MFGTLRGSTVAAGVAEAAPAVPSAACCYNCNYCNYCYNAAQVKIGIVLLLAIPLLAILELGAKKAKV